MRIGQRLQRAATPLVAVLVLGACASSGETMEELPTVEADEAAIVVDNEESEGRQVTVYLLPQPGARVELGQVMLGQRQEFVVDMDEVPDAARYRLEADAINPERTGNNQDLTSEDFALTRGEIVEWELNVNRLVRLVP